MSALHEWYLSYRAMEDQTNAAPDEAVPAMASNPDAAATGGQLETSAGEP